MSADKEYTMTILKLGDSVTRGSLKGEIVAVMTKPDGRGHTHVILSEGLIYLCRGDGTSPMYGNWTKERKKVKGTVYLNIYPTSCSTYKKEAEARHWANLKYAHVVAMPVEYEYEVED